MNDSTLNSDYFFLEDVLDHVESGKRLLRKVGGSGDSARKHEQKHPHKRLRMNLDERSQAEEKSDARHLILQSAAKDNVGKLADRITAAAVVSAVESVDVSNDAVVQPGRTNAFSLQHKHRHQYIQQPKQRFLIQQASARGITLLLMPSGMTRHKENKSFYSNKTDSISWTVEWLFYPAEHATIATRGFLQLDEKVALWDAIREEVPQLAETDYCLLLKKLPCPASRPSFVAVPLAASLADALQDMTVFEYPTVYVVPHCRKEEFPLAVEQLT